MLDRFNLKERPQ